MDVMAAQVTPLTNYPLSSTCIYGVTVDPTKCTQKEYHMSEDAPLTLSVPEAGKRYFGLSRNAAYEAAARGDLPVIRIGRLLRVPVRAMERMLERASEPAA
jgi:Helix-turn-helix domain